MPWHPHLYAIASRSMQPQGGLASSNIEESPREETMIVDAVWEMITFDFLPVEARRLFAFYADRLPAGYTVKTLIDRGTTMEEWIKRLPRMLPVSNDAPSLADWLECRPTRTVAASMKWRSQDQKYDGLLSNLEPWKIKWPARFRIRR